MRKILVVTGTRAEYGLLYWTMKAIEEDKDLELQLIATGNHLVPEYGLTIEQIKKDGFNIDEEIDMMISSNNKSAVLKSMGIEMIQLASAFDRLKPDILLILGDRYETFVAATCAMMMNIPIAHMNGGESTEGLIDEQIRHAITKMAHIHLAGAEYYKERIIKMGEESWRVHNVGQSGVESIKRINFMSKEELEKQLNIKFNREVFLVTYHPVTLDLDNTEYQIDQLIKALKKYDAQIIFTYPNADFGSKIIIDKIKKYESLNENVNIIYSLGQLKYLSLLKYSDIIIGNSSSGIIEAPVFNIPVVNIGDRQKGRIRNKNIIDCGYNENDIIKAIDIALNDNSFRSQLNYIENVYGDGNTSKRIVHILKDVYINKNLINKKLTY
ncbi:UDP-N-acetylglucosamine 2-epimerase [Clostridium lundense]|uniref:UDP-N-acetylglucosamine 2-epimerase n=1 Tax=Clostridium lundense TaxID=319475 RepID=UPI000480AD79|nr:UDP-N-acetylglucosamine 2-epimerase [Clostridium lundense]